MRGMVWVIDNLVSLVQEFATVATADPLSAVLLALGAVLTAFAAGSSWPAVCSTSSPPTPGAAARHGAVTDGSRGDFFG